MYRGIAQLVERVVWDHEVARSNRVTPTNLKQFLENCRKLKKVERVLTSKVSLILFFYGVLKNLEKS